MTAKPEVLQLTSAMRRDVVENVVNLVGKNYIYPDVAAQVGDMLRTNLKSGRYDDLFILDGIDGFRSRFERDEAGQIVRLVDMWSDGHQEVNRRGQQM